MSALIGRRANAESCIVACDGDIVCGKERTEFDCLNSRDISYSNITKGFRFFLFSITAISNKNVLFEREFDILEIFI